MVSSALPLNVPATLIGHLNLDTTRGYTNPRELQQMGPTPVGHTDRPATAPYPAHRHTTQQPDAPDPNRIDSRGAPVPTVASGKGGVRQGPDRGMAGRWFGWSNCACSGLRP
jgi:hypothetical protein